MPLTRSAGQRTLAQNGSLDCRRNPSRQSRAYSSRTSTQSDASPPSTHPGRAREVSADPSGSDSSAVRSRPGSHHDPKSPSGHPIQRRSTRIATGLGAGHGGDARHKAKGYRRSKKSLQSLPPVEKEDKAKSKGRPAAASSSPSRQRQTASEGIHEMPPIEGPDWTDPRIPYHFWVDVFLYARSEGGADAPNTHWLLQVATACRLLSEPALTAIYRCPVIRHPSKARRLVSLLERCPTETRFNYRRKIEFLHVDVHIVPQAIVYQLIHRLTRLKELIFYTPTDQPPYRKLDTHVRWHYSDDIFLALASPSPDNSEALVEKPVPINLKSWEWSGSLLGGDIANSGDILRVHQMPSFARLTRLSFTNFQVPSLRNLQPKPEIAGDDLQSYLEDDAAIDAVAGAIAELKFLKHLVFESSTIMTDRLLPLLPKHLIHLELINCWEIKSEELAMFLITHGRSLRALTLMHNQSLNLAFLTILAEACPSLRELRMNMSYYRHHDSLNDADPMYDFALLPDQLPRWPSSIRVIDIEHIRNWSVDTAQMFIQSLVDNARDLPNLRHLVIKTMLDIPWQARAALRSKLRPMVERVFLRTVEPPQEGMPLQQTSSTYESLKSRKRKRPLSSKPPLRRSGRIEAHIRGSHRRPRGDNTSRDRQLRRPLYREPETDEDEFDITDSSDSVSSEVPQSSSPHVQLEPATQGLCDTVSIVFDNQKVRELQYSMEDFLTDDDESSGEEWDGDDDDEYDFAVAF
ncbi:hypothetical protein V8C37DRAFT_390926 [Trichoderma ceciliae]